MSIEKYIANIIEREGGYVNHPSDKGGPTKYGITLKTLSEYRRGDIEPSDVEGLTVDEAYKIYKKIYLTDSGIINIADYRLQALMLDTAIHSGPGRAVKLLQQALGIVDDGVIGPVTIQFTNAVQSMDVLRKNYLAGRIVFIGAIISKDPTQAVFAKGWLTRCADLLRTLC